MKIKSPRRPGTSQRKIVLVLVLVLDASEGDVTAQIVFQQSIHKSPEILLGYLADKETRDAADTQL